LILIIYFMIRRLQNSPNRAMAYVAGRTVPYLDGTGHSPVKANADFLAGYAAKQRMGSRISGVASAKTAVREEAPVSHDGLLMLSLFVEDQNTAIGRRNRHTVKTGYSYTIGGGKSDFLIFLVPIPPHIAEVRFDGQQCTFIPRRPQFFPDLGSRSLTNCTGKDIRLVSEKNYELTIRIERYEDPLKSLNRLLNSVNLPGQAPGS
jgi:hypothetical protein